jgi:hypothetical protein
LTRQIVAVKLSEVSTELKESGGDNASSAGKAGAVEGELIDAPPLDPAVAHLLARSEENASKRNLLTLSDATIATRVKAICKEVRQSLPLESACWFVGVDPDDLAEAAQRNPLIRIQVNQALAHSERELLRTLKAGGKGTDPAKAALAILQRTVETWRTKANVNLAAQFRDALVELKKRLKGQMSGEQALKIVIDVFSRHV